MARSAFAALLLAGALAVPAAAEAPQPSACGGMAFTDPADDTDIDFTGVAPSGQQAPENHDIIGGFFRYDTVGGKNVLTANIIVKNLTKDLATGANAASWYMYWELGEETKLVSARTDGDGFAYEWGRIDPTSGSNSTQGETTGSVVEGPNGVITIVVPAENGGAGKSLASPYAVSRVTFQTPEVPVVGSAGYVPGADTAPDDEAGGKTFKVQLCETAAAPPGEGGANPPVQAPQVNQPQTGEPPAAKAYKLTASPSKLKARKVKRAKKLRFTLKTTEPLTALTAQLKKGSKVLGKGSLRALESRGRLTVKLARKGLKKGRYALVLAGKRADGSAATATVTVSVK